MTKTGKLSLYWTPRVLSIAFLIFLSMFALDVFGEGYGVWETLRALAIHLLPSLVLLAALILAWRWEWIGALMFAIAGTLYIGMVSRLTRISSGMKIEWILIVAGPAFVIALLFLANWWHRSELHPGRSRA